MTYGMHHLALPVSFSLFVIATTEIPDHPLAAWGAGITATGAILWWFWYTNTRTIPKLTDDYKKELTEERTMYRELAEENRNMYREEMKAERDSREQGLQAMMDSWTSEMEKCRETHRQN